MGCLTDEQLARLVLGQAGDPGMARHLSSAPRAALGWRPCGRWGINLPRGTLDLTEITNRPESGSWPCCQRLARRPSRCGCGIWQHNGWEDLP